MYICKNCGQTYSDPVKFCGKCGGNSFETQQQGGYQQPAYGASYSNPAPDYSYAEPAPATASKAPAIVGMIFGVVALIFAFICIGMASSASSEADSYYYYSYYYYRPSLSAIRTAAYIVLGYLSIFFIPSFIVGLIMSFKKSAIKAMSIVGRITSFVGLGLYIISFIIVASIG